MTEDLSTKALLSNIKHGQRWFKPNGIANSMAKIKYNDMERRLGIMQSVEPVLENAIKTLQKVVDVRGMGKSSLLQIGDDVLES